MEHIGVITEHSIEEGKQGNYHKITVEPDKWSYSLFDAKLFDLCKKGKGVKVSWEKDKTGKFRNVTTIEEVEPPKHENGERMSKEDWAQKDLQIIRQVIFKGFMEHGEWKLNPDESVEWCAGKRPYKLPTHETPQPQSTPVSTKDKPAEIPPEKGANTSGFLIPSATQLWAAMNNEIVKLKWQPAQVKAELLKLAKSENWDNAELIAQNGLKEISRDAECLFRFVDYLKQR